MFLKITAAILILFNVLLFGMIVYFSKGVKDKNSKIGFGFMELLTLANAFMIGGLTWVF